MRTNHPITGLGSLCPDHFKTIQHVNKHEIVFHNLYIPSNMAKRGHLETTPPFTVPFERHEAQLFHRSHLESNPGLLRGSSNGICVMGKHPNINAETQIPSELVAWQSFLSVEVFKHQRAKHYS